MVPKVLALHPQLAYEVLPSGLVPTTWDSRIFWMDETFSFGRSFQSTSLQDHSPFLLLEARHAFVVSLMNNQADTYFAGMSELSSLLFFLRSESHFYSTTPFESSLRDYTDRSIKEGKIESYPQMVLWESDLRLHLEFLAPHARLLLASTTGMPEIPHGFDLHQKWSYAEDSEIGKLFLLELTR